MTPEDELTLIVLATVLLIPISGAFSHAAAIWLVQHRILVPAAHALIHLPGNAGLDTSRILAIVGVLALLVAFRGLRARRSAGDQPPATAPHRSHEGG